MGNAATDVASEQTQPSFITAQPGESEERRSGRPYDLAYEQSRDSLFLDGVHSTDKSQGRGITPFFVRSIYLAFLGRLAFTGQTGAPRTPTGIFEWPPEAMRDHVMREQDPGPGVSLTTRQAKKMQPQNAPLCRSQARGHFQKRHAKGHAKRHTRCLTIGSCLKNIHQIGTPSAKRAMSGWRHPMAI